MIGYAAVPGGLLVIRSVQLSKEQVWWVNKDLPGYSLSEGLMLIREP